MNDNARLLIVERVIPPGNEPFVGKLVDITMLIHTGGMERTLVEFRRLLEAAGLKLNRMIPMLTGAPVM